MTHLPSYELGVTVHMHSSMECVHGVKACMKGYKKHMHGGWACLASNELEAIEQNLASSMLEVVAIVGYIGDFFVLVLMLVYVG